MHSSNHFRDGRGVALVWTALARVVPAGATTMALAEVALAGVAPAGVAPSGVMAAAKVVLARARMAAVLAVRTVAASKLSMEVGQIQQQARPLG